MTARGRHFQHVTARSLAFRTVHLQNPKKKFTLFLYIVPKCHTLSGVYVYIVATVVSTETQYTPLFHIFCVYYGLKSELKL